VDMRILITEDEKDLADALARGLRQQGYAADIAYDGEEALVMAEVNDYISSLVSPSSSAGGKSWMTESAFWLVRSL